MPNNEPMADAESGDEVRDSSAETDPAGLEALLDYIHRNRGFDFTGYKRTSLARRIRRRMQMIGVDMYIDCIEHIEVETVALLAETGEVVGTQLSFADTIDAHRLQHELRKANLELEKDHEELQATSEELRATSEELRLRDEELTNATSLRGAVFASLRPGVAVLDRELLVRAWNLKMENLWGVRFSEVSGKQFVTLDIGLPIEETAGATRTSLGSGEEAQRTVQCTNRRGRSIECRVTVTPLDSQLHQGVTVTVEGSPS